MPYYAGMKRVVFLLSLLALAACVGKPVDQMSYSELKALAETVIKRCEAQGVKHGTQEMKLCTDQELLRETSIRNEVNAMQSRTVVCNTVYNTVICN